MTDESTNTPARSAPTPGDGWRVVVEENWNEFDTDRWSVGFVDRAEWVPDDDATVSPDHVSVRDGQCVLEIESAGTGPAGCHQGVINASVGGLSHHPSVGVAIDPSPGQYVEARLRLPGRTGLLPAFWMHAADTTWPPEIDVVELLQRGDDPAAARRRLHADVHWSQSGEPGDRSSHEHAPTVVDTGVDLTTGFHRYGCAWFTDRVEWYFDGRRVATRREPTPMLASLTDDAARPFAPVFSTHVNRIGEADLSTAWSEKLVIDQFRLLEVEQ